MFKIIYHFFFVKPKTHEMNQFHGIFFGYFPFSESKILTFMENIIKKLDKLISRVFLVAIEFVFTKQMIY